MNNPRTREPDPRLRELYPEMSDEELLEAEENLDRYAALVCAASTILAGGRQLFLPVEPG
jgi:hypothetical protein